MKNEQLSLTKAYLYHLNGKSLDGITSTENIEKIRIYSKYSGFSITQIVEKSGLLIGEVGDLRQVQRSYLRNTANPGKTTKVKNLSKIVKSVLCGKKASEVQLIYGCSDETIKSVCEIVKRIKRGANAADLFKMGLSHGEAVTLLKEWERINAVKEAENKKAKVIV